MYVINDRGGCSSKFIQKNPYHTDRHIHREWGRERKGGISNHHLTRTVYIYIWSSDIAVCYWWWQRQRERNRQQKGKNDYNQKKSPLSVYLYVVKQNPFLLPSHNIPKMSSLEIFCTTIWYTPTRAINSHSLHSSFFLFHSCNLIPFNPSIPNRLHHPKLFFFFVAFFCNKHSSISHSIYIPRHIQQSRLFNNASFICIIFYR